MAVGLLKHREAARLKREGHWLGERKGDRVIREAVRLVTEREVKRLERERAARNWVVERSEREREREVERERELERLERERAARKRVLDSLSAATVLDLYRLPCPACLEFCPHLPPTWHYVQAY